MPRVFISYSRSDGDFVEVLQARLAGEGFECWIDLEGLRAGEEWGQEIDQAIRDSFALIVVLSPASCRSAYVSYEWAFALGAEVTVIPLLLQAAEIHPRLAALQHLDFIRRDDRPWPSLFGALEDAARARPAYSITIPRKAPPVVRDAIAALDHPDKEVMEKAVLRLAQLKIPEAESALVEALHHPLIDVRIAAAWQLSARKDPRAVPALIEGDRQRGWRMELARKLGQIGSAALPGIRESLKDEDPLIRRDLIWAIQEVGDVAAIPDLVQLVRDSDLRVRHEAARALKRFGTKESLSAFNEALTEFRGDLQSGDEKLRRETLQFLESLK